MTLSLRILCLGLIALPAAREGAAQSDPRLVAAVRLAHEGRSDSARTVVSRLLAGLQPSDSLYPEALYTAGLLAATERDRRLPLRRVVVDFSQSAWADDALLQLAQLDYAGGDPLATIRQIELLLRDYPGSPITGVAALWGARAAGDRREADRACRMADLGLSAAGDDIELRNQLAFQKQRCQGLAALVAESAQAALADSVARARADSLARARGTRVPARPAAPRAGASGYFVQVSAVNTEAAAAIESERVKGAGYAAVIVKEGGYLKIRAGSFASRAAAEAALTRIRSQLGGHPFLVHVP